MKKEEKYNFRVKFTGSVYAKLYFLKKHLNMSLTKVVVFLIDSAYKQITELNKLDNNQEVNKDAKSEETTTEQQQLS